MALDKDIDKLFSKDVKVYSLREAKENSIDLNHFLCEKEEFTDHFLNVLPNDDSQGLGKAFYLYIMKRL